MDRLTQDLLAYTRISSGELVLERVDLDQVIDEVLEGYPSLQEVSRHIQVQKPLGSCLGHVPSLAQCFSNLLENAVNFAKPGQPPEIEVRSKVHGDQLRVSIIDHGIGIAPGESNRISACSNGEERTHQARESGWPSLKKRPSV